MKIRIMALSLMLTLSGCSTFDGVFGKGESSASVSKHQIGKISDQTPFSEEGLAQALGTDYHLRSGMGMKNGELFSFYQALKNFGGKEQIAQIIYGKYDGGIVKVEVFEPSVSTGEASIGAPFSSVFAQAFGACELEANGAAQEVVCQSVKTPNIHYVFSGEWDGPKELIPDNEALKDWKVSKIIWLNTLAH